MIRTLILLGMAGALVAAFYFYNGNKDDWEGIVKAETNGTIAAIESGPDGDQVVFVKPDGTVTHDKAFVKGSYDRELAWSPDGNNAFFISDRVKDEKSGTRSVHVFRWNASKEESQVRTVGNRSRGNPTFPVGPAAASDTCLIVSAGEVLELDPKTKKTTQVLPPRNPEGGKLAGEGEGKESAFTSAYGEMGTSFRLARWAKGKQWIAAIMHREEGEILVCQNMQLHDGKYDQPIPLAAGQHIDLAVSPDSNAIYFAVRDFQWPSKNPPPDAIKNGVVTRPFVNYIAAFDLDSKAQQRIVVVAPDATVCFGSPAVSPDGKQLAAVAGKYPGDGGIEPMSLIVMPTTMSKGNPPKGYARGYVSDPSWSPNGKQLLFLMRDADNVRTIYRMATDGATPPEAITKGKFNYSSPLFSPQTK